jgi:hypothetical protein
MIIFRIRSSKSYFFRHSGGSGEKYFFKLIFASFFFNNFNIFAITLRVLTRPLAVQDIAIYENREVGCIDSRIACDFLNLVVCEGFHILLFSGSHYRHSLFQLLQLLGTWAGKHSEFACAFQVPELSSDQAAVFVIRERRYFFKVLFD